MEANGDRMGSIEDRIHELSLDELFEQKFHYEELIAHFNDAEDKRIYALICKEYAKRQQQEKQKNDRNEQIAKVFRNQIQDLLDHGYSLKDIRDFYHVFGSTLDTFSEEKGKNRDSI